MYPQVTCPEKKADVPKAIKKMLGEKMPCVVDFHVERGRERLAYGSVGQEFARDGRIRFAGKYGVASGNLELRIEN